MTDQRRDLLKIRVELIGFSPPIWREILVPARYSFWDLHVAVQDAMGWLDYHLHEFRFGGSSRNEALLIGIPSDEMWDDAPEVQPGWDIPVIDFLSEPGDRAEYEYDFGDGWVHELTLMCVEPREKGASLSKVCRGWAGLPAGGLWWRPWLPVIVGNSV